MALTAIAAIVGLYSARQANVEAARRYEKEIAELKADHEYVAAENKYLRQELGCLTITEPTKLHAVKVRTDQPKTWSYRVHLPEGRQYYFACRPFRTIHSRGRIPWVYTGVNPWLQHIATSWLTPILGPCYKRFIVKPPST